MGSDRVKFTENDCKVVLEKYFNGNNSVKFVSFNMQPISNCVNGYMGEHLRLEIEVNDGTKSEYIRFFVKTLNAEQDAMAEFIKSGNMFNKEITWYQFLSNLGEECPDFDITFAPKYYHSKENEFIVLEDLVNSGYKMPEKFHLNAEHIHVALKSVAKYHSASILFEERRSKKLGRKYNLTEDYPEFLKEAMYRKDENYLGYKYIMCGMKALQALIDVLPESGLSRELFKEKLSALVDRAFEDSKPSEQYRNVWCNGDLWAKNIMFEYNNDVPVNCKIFDFQLQRYNPPAHDVFFMIYEATNKKQRQRHLEDYLNFYYSALSAELKQYGVDVENILNRDEFDNTCNMVAPIIKLSKTIYVSISAMNAEAFKNVTKDPHAYAKLTFEDRSEFVVQLFNSDENYRKVMTVFLQDLRDVLGHDKISIEDCYKITREKLGTTEYDLLEYQVTPFAEKCGFLGEHSNLKIKVMEKNEVKEMQFFVKNIPREIGQRNFVIESDIFLKEMKLYLKIIPDMVSHNVTCIEGCSPKCYLGRLNDVLVFDDYSVKGYTTLNSRIPFSYEIVAVVIKKLAKLHASALILEEKLSRNGHKFKLVDYYRKELNEAFYNKNKASVDANTATMKGVLTQIDLFPDRKSKISEGVFKKRASKAICRLSEHVKSSTKYRNTLCHGDLWSNNILLKFENGAVVDCLFVDYQSTRYGPPGQDLVGFLYLATDSKFRTNYWLKVIDLYYFEISNIFSDYGINVNTVLPYGELLQSCEDMREFAAAQCMNHFHNIKLTSAQIKELFDDHEYARKIMFEDRSENIVKICKADPVYKQLMLECITDLREVCENSSDLE